MGNNDRIILVPKMLENELRKGIKVNLSDFFFFSIFMRLEIVMKHDHSFLMIPDYPGSRNLFLTNCEAILYILHKSQDSA
jgi:hypothetical protein